MNVRSINVITTLGDPNDTSRIVVTFGEE